MQKANLHSVKMARKCIAKQTKTFEKQQHREREIPLQQRLYLQSTEGH